MPNQEPSRDGIPRKDEDRSSPEVERSSTEAGGRATGGGQRPAAGGRSNEHSGERYEGDGPGQVGLASDRQPDLVAPSGVNERDHGAADDKPMGGGPVNFDDDDLTHPRGRTTATGGTNQARGGDSAPLGPPREIQSRRNGPSDPHSRKQ